MEAFEITDKASPSISTIVSSTYSPISVACKHANASTANGEVAGFLPVHIARKSTTKDSPKSVSTKHCILPQPLTSAS
ncbi:hypothetical protein J1N35_044145 [Gossypium stocksii]|uniref:Uncharacterized protein n=1 Tax=Gossypium stocksii TaxID=47602 RepID=A0A9D3ZFQ2_9ROSI|nr:hypothetical protein J1N35_044145 [Gossypium stocksii]